jgi:putative copper resistance protein D
MAGFVDVLLRGLMLAGGALALGGVVFVLAVLRTAPGTKPDARTARALRLVAMGAAAVALAQLVTTGVALASLLQDFGAAATAPFARTTFALATLARTTLGVTTALLAVSLARAPRGRIAWLALTTAAVLLVGSSAAISHAMARLEHRAMMTAVDIVHQLAAAIWVGGLIHLLATLRESDSLGRLPPPSPSARAVARRFSTLALVSVATLVTAGGGLSVAYVGDARALLETAYGVMVLTKVVLLGAILGLGVANFRLVRRAATRPGDVRLARFVEVEMGLAVTVLFAAASLTSLPPAADVLADRATLAEVGARFTAMPPRLASPAIGDLLQQTNPLAGGPETRLQVEREWSEFNHHWAGIFVLAMGLAAMAHRAGVREARHWPLLLVGLALFLFVRNDPEVWPLGPIGFWSSLAQPEVLQHRAFMTLAMLFGVFEWAVRAGVLTPRPWAYVFPMICAVAGGLLLTHSHAVFSLKEAFLMEVTHAPIGVLGAFAGWARWLELRLPEAEPLAGRLWPACLTAIGILLILYSEG